jgi:hypothetical protein
MNGDTKLRFHLTIIGVFAAAMLAVVIFMSMNASATFIGDAYPGFGDWIITQDTTVIDEWVDVYDGDIILQGGNLAVWNSYINMELVFDSEYHNITVPAGRTLQANDSTIESWFDYFNLDVKGNLVTDNVDFNWMNWTTLSGTVVANDTHLYYILEGLQIDATMVYNNGTMMYIYNGFNITGTTSMFNTRIIRADPGLILSGGAMFSYCAFEYQFNTMTWSSTVSTDNCTFRYIYEFNITSTTLFVEANMFRISDGMNMPGTVTIRDSYLAALYNFNATGTVTVINSTHNSIYNGMLLSGTVSINLCTYWYNSVGVFVSNDAVSVTNTRFNNMYDSGFHFQDCDASLNNVTIRVFTGSSRSYFSTGNAGDWNDRYTMAMGLGIEVIGGAPTFVDVDVEADSTGYFYMDYTGSEQETWVYTRAIVAAVLIDSTEMRTVNGLTIHDSSMSVRNYVTATNPGMFPLYLWVEMEIYAAGLAVMDYSNITITDVESYNNRRGSVSGPYISGTAYGGSGYRYYRDQWQIRCSS